MQLDPFPLMDDRWLKSAPQIWQISDNDDLPTFPKSLSDSNKLAFTCIYSHLLMSFPIVHRSPSFKSEYLLQLTSWCWWRDPPFDELSPFSPLLPASRPSKAGNIQCNRTRGRFSTSYLFPVDVSAQVNGEKWQMQIVSDNGGLLLLRKENISFGKEWNYCWGVIDRGGRGHCCPLSMSPRAE